MIFPRKACFFYLIMILAWVLGLGVVKAAEIRVAVASNFAKPIKVLAQKFEKNTGHRVVLIFGSTGNHYAQIKNGAPFQLFFAADAKRPQLLEEEGRVITGSRFTYARGGLALWSPQSGYVDTAGKVLSQKKFNHLAIANPKLAPYGQAAQQVLRSLGLWEGLQNRLVQGSNVGQAFQFVQSGNAQLGFVAIAQIMEPGQEPAGSYWVVPQSLYDPIEQQAVQLQKDNTSRAFLDFVKSKTGRAIIREYGYQIP